MQQSTESIEETGERIRNEYEGERAQIEEQCATEKTSNVRGKGGWVQEKG